MSGVEVVVTVTDGGMQNMTKVLRELRANGMQVREVLDAVGLVLGDAADPAALRQILGVASVEAPTSFSVPPPGEDPL